MGAFANAGGVAVPQNANENGCYWKEATDDFIDNQSSQAKITTMADSGSYVAVRMSGSTTATEAYLFGAASSGGAGVMYLQTGGSTFTQLGATYAAISNGDTIKLKVVGSVLTPYINGVAQSTRTEGTVVFGQPGIFCYNGNGATDDWVGNNEYASTHLGMLQGVGR